MTANTMLKHRGGCRAAGGEKPPKSEGGGSERQRAGVIKKLGRVYADSLQIHETTEHP